MTDVEKSDDHKRQMEKSSSPMGLSLRQESVQKLLFTFSKTFISVMESTVFSKSESDEFEDEEADEYFDNFGTDSSYSTLELEQFQLVSDEEFAFEKYFQPEQKEYFRDLFTSVAFDIFKSYEYQLIMLVIDRRKISEIAEDIVHRILDNFKESQRGFNPDYIRPEITRQFLIEKALQHSEPEGIIYNSEWSAVEILENPGILIRTSSPVTDNSKVQVENNSSSSSTTTSPTPTAMATVCNFYKSHWQKNFIGVKKKIGSKYGFRLKFDFETEEGIQKNFEKVPIKSVSPLYLEYAYCIDSALLASCKKTIDKELHIEDKMKKYGIVGEEKNAKDKVKEFQMKLLIQKQKEDQNSDKVMKQVVNLSQRFEKLQSKLGKLEQSGIISGNNGNEVARAKIGLLRSNYNVRFEVRDQNNDFAFNTTEPTNKNKSK